MQFMPEKNQGIRRVLQMIQVSLYGDILKHLKL